MKKLLMVLLVFSMALFALSCGKDKGESTKESTIESVKESVVESVEESQSQSTEHIHQGVRVAPVEADCSTSGNIEYWTCDCGKLFQDANCTVEISLADTVVSASHDIIKVNAREATCVDSGNVEYWVCQECFTAFDSQEGTNVINVTDTIIAPTGEHVYVDDVCVTCGKDLFDKQTWITAGEECESVTYTEGKGWKVVAGGESNYYIKVSHEVTAHFIEQGKDQMTLTFCDAFDGATFGTASNGYENKPINCRIWILPPNATDGSNDWTYEVSQKMQSELINNGDGTYSHTINLLNMYEDSLIYDFSNYDLTIYIDYKAANTNEVVGCIYVKDIEYSSASDVVADKQTWVRAGENCASATYTEDKGWKVVASGDSNYYIKINHEITAYYIQNGCDQMTLTFCDAFDGATFGTASNGNENKPINCRIWILPPNASNGSNDWAYPISQKMQSELSKNEDGTYSHTIDLMNMFEGSLIYDFSKYDLTIYIDYKAANTNERVGCIYIKDIDYSTKPELVDAEREDYFLDTENSSTITYADGLGWKVQANAGLTHYYFELTSQSLAYHVENGYDKLKISFGTAFDGTIHEGRPTVCRIWVIPRTVSGEKDWEYKVDYIHNLEAEMDGTYSVTIDLHDARYNFVDYNLQFYVDTVDGGTGNYVGACYVYNVEYIEEDVVEEESYLAGVKLYQMGTVNSQLSMAYVMVTEANEVIVIDGGRNADEGEALYNFIVELKGEAVVDAWYLSHYHGDHIEALTQILKTYPITIRNLYFDFPTDDALIAQYGDGDNVFLYDFYEALEQNSAKVLNIVTPRKGDVQTYTGLEIRVLNDSLFGEGMGYVNNSSVVYKAVTADESVLFLGDMGSYGMTLLEDEYFRTEIATCTIIQMAHHGNSDLIGNFYSNITDIKVCLFPCLAWVFNNDAGSGFNSGTMNTVKTRQYLESRGVELMYTQVNGTVCIE